MTSALFGRSSTGLGSTGGFKHLVEVKAGKMNLKGKMVLPDKRKGLLFLYRSDDSLIHFCWQDRTSGFFTLLFLWGMFETFYSFGYHE